MGELPRITRESGIIFAFNIECPVTLFEIVGRQSGPVGGFWIAPVVIPQQAVGLIHRAVRRRRLHGKQPHQRPGGRIRVSILVDFPPEVVQLRAARG